MESLQILPKPSHPSFLMNSISTKVRCISYSKLRTFCASSIDLKNTHQLINGGKRKKRVGVKVSEAQLKENWLNSLTCPVPEKEEDLNSVGKSRDSGLEWVIGIDPDLSGALALLKSDEVGCSAEVFDSPILQVMVGNRVRKRLDAKSIVQMLRSFDSPLGTVAYIEQSTPFPKDGKQGWWGGGFGYGMWIGILVASGYSVVPVSSMLWKNHFKLSGSQLTKDDSRKAAGTLFPHLSSQLKRKKDHGRAEALLIAAYGKGLQIKSEPFPN